MTSEQPSTPTFIAGTDWPLQGTPITEWIAQLEERRGDSFTRVLNLKEKIAHEGQDGSPNVLLVGSGEIEPLEYGLAGFHVTAYERDSDSAKRTTALIERAGVSGRVTMVPNEFNTAAVVDRRVGQYKLIVLDRVLHYFTPSDAIGLLSKIQGETLSGCRIKAKIFLKNSEIFSRPNNPYFTGNNWDPTVDEVLALFPEDKWSVEYNSGEQSSPSPMNGRENMFNYSVSLIVKKK